MELPDQCSSMAQTGGFMLPVHCKPSACLVSKTQELDAYALFLSFLELAHDAED
jgi:hypothetical protein